MEMCRASGIPTAILRVRGASLGAFTARIVAVVKAHAHIVSSYGTCQEHHLTHERLTRT
jgi:hypothetical protein